MEKFFLLLLFFFVSKSSSEILNIHIIPHSHQDPGWLTTMENYYTGNSPDQECVKCMIDRVMNIFKNDKKFKITWAELAFLDLWFSTVPGSKNILLARFSILRVKKCLATPRVAALQHHQTCDEWNHNSDEPKCKFTIYPLASEND